MKTPIYYLQAFPVPEINGRPVPQKWETLCKARSYRDALRGADRAAKVYADCAHSIRLLDKDNKVVYYTHLMLPLIPFDQLFARHRVQ